MLYARDGHQRIFQRIFVIKYFQSFESKSAQRPLDRHGSEEDGALFPDSGVIPELETSRNIGFLRDKETILGQQGAHGAGKAVQIVRVFQQMPGDKHMAASFFSREGARAIFVEEGLNRLRIGAGRSVSQVLPRIDQDSSRKAQVLE